MAKNESNCDEDSVAYKIPVRTLFTHTLAPVKPQSLHDHEHDTASSETAKSSISKSRAVAAQPSKHHFTVLSLNVWGAPQDEANPYFQFEKRSSSILDIIQRLDPDVICLQEVSKRWAEKLLQSQHIRTKYYSTDADSERVHGYFGLSQMTFSKYPMLSATSYGLPGFEIYSLLNTQIQIDDKLVSINNIHLHSGKEHSAFRIAQLKTIDKVLSETEALPKIMTGDFNFGDSWAENAHIDKHFTDVWQTLHPNDPGYTEDSHANTMRFKIKNQHKQERFDRTLYQGNELIAKEVTMVGTESIDEELWPSDHFGLFTQFHLQKARATRSPASSTITKQEIQLDESRQTSVSHR